MITGYQKFQLPDINADKNSITAEVNYSDDPHVKDCQVIRLTLPHGKKMYIKRDHLNQILFAIGKEEDQRKLIPQKLSTVHHRQTVLGIKATKDIKKGEMINFPMEFAVPCDNVKSIIGHGAWDKSTKQELKELENKHKHIITPTKAK